MMALLFVCLLQLIARKWLCQIACSRSRPEYVTHACMHEAQPCMEEGMCDRKNVKQAKEGQMTSQERHDRAVSLVREAAQLLAKMQEEGEPMRDVSLDLAQACGHDVDEVHEVMMMLSELAPSK